ncbi:hypothetical protein J4E83_010444 [Alternaria metachromatica]|uniref:uncharacterized protein n=1 Tax=Alternaria metachromatica TaxID=283354 RepID=UPI0020C20E82|nr:uncharacterized protein J4E83_010444 [Alternaria metachromatica]KAI4605781.1 hypothetical protein J4E83_010444 [Alternaria metachromatica]
MLATFSIIGRLPHAMELFEGLRELFESLDLEQKQAYLLALRGYTAATLVLEGCPGTGKSHTLRAICVAMVLMGYHVFVSAHFNNGVDAVFEKVAKWARKVAKWARKNRPQWMEEGVLCHVGASTVDESLFKRLNRHWEDPNVDEDYSDGLISSISAFNIPNCAAYKFAK